MAILRNERLERIEQLGKFTLRELDEEECEAGGYSGHAAVAVSIETSDESFSVWVEGRLLAMWGYRRGSVTGGGALIWLLTTDEVERYKVTFYKEAKRLLKELMEEFSWIGCEPWCQHTQAVRMLTKFGFFTQEKPFSEFYRMTKGLYNGVS